MATIYWKGTSTDPLLQSSWSDHATSGAQISDTNWNTGDLSAHDVIVGQYGNGALTASAMIIPAHTVNNGSYAKSFKSLTIIERADAHSSYSSSVPVQFNGASITLTLGVGGLFIKKANCLQASHDTIIKFTGAVNSDNTYIKFDSSIDTELNTTEHGMFSDSTNRSRFTFKFEPGTNITLELTNGVYPNLEGVASSNTCTLSATAPLNNLSTISYTTIDILNLTVDVNFKISPARQTEADFAKTFNLEGNLIILTDTFFWGNSTVRFTPVTTTSYIPVSGSYRDTAHYKFGVDTVFDFNAKYNKIIISYAANNKFILPASSILLCHHLEIESGGRLYGPNTTAIEGAEIHSIQRPTIHGDWNFTQIADGIYRTRKTLLPQQEYHDILSTNRNHYGGNGDVLSITGGKLEWSSSAGGSAFAVSDITGATELTSGLADADELVLSDGGVLKRMDISVLKTYMQAGLTFTTNTNTQNTTTLSFVDSSNDIILRNTTGGAGSGTDDIKFVAGSNITLTHTDADNITIASTDTNTDVDVSVANLKSALNSDFGGDVIFGSQTDDNVKYKGTVSIGDIDNAGSAKLSVNGFSTMNGLFLGYGSGPGYIKTYNSSDNLELYAHNGTDHIKMIELDAANDTLTLGATGDTVTINDDLVVTGDLTVSGTTTTLNTATLDVEDLNITVGKAANSSSAANGAGLTFGAWSSGTIPTLTWVHADSRLAVNKALYSSGGFVGSLTGNVTGNVSGNAGTVTLTSDNGNASHYVTFADAATGSEGLKTDDQLVFNPNSGRLTANVFVGDLAGDVTGDVTGDLTGNADTVTNGVYTTGNQSIAGVKTFTSSPLLKAGLDLVNPNLAGAMGITLQNEDGKFLLYTDEGQLVIKDFLVDTGASTDGTDTFPFKLQSGAATDTFIIKTGGRVDVSGALHAGSFVGDVTGNVSGSSGSTTGNAATATKLATARAINGVNFDGSAAITVTADATTLTGTSLKSTVVGSSLTSVGTLTALTGGTGDLIWDTDTLVVDSSTDRVGIGTTSPAAQLQIDTPDSNSAGNGLRLNRPSSGDKYHAVEFATNGTVDWGVGQNNNDAFEVYENGAANTTRFTIKEGGNVGIGTTSPEDLLHLSKGNLMFDQLNNQTSSNFTNHSKILFRDEADATTRTMASIGAPKTAWSGSHHALTFNTGSLSETSRGEDYDYSIERMRIDSAGNVGIGTTAPEYKLDVQSGSIRILPTISSNAGTAIRIGAGGNSNDITLLRIDGESSNNSGESDSGQYGFSMKYMGSGSGTGNRYAMFMDNQAGTAIEAMSILQDGKVGIGDSTPATTLEVYDGSDANIRVRGNSNYATTLEVTSSGCKLHMGDIDSAEDSFLTFGAFSAINNLDTSGRDFHLYGTNTTTGFYFDESAGKCWNRYYNSFYCITS